MEEQKLTNEDLQEIFFVVYRMEQIARKINKIGMRIKKSEHYNEKKLLEGYPHLKNAIQFGLKIKLK